MANQALTEAVIRLCSRYPVVSLIVPLISAYSIFYAYQMGTEMHQVLQTKWMQVEVVETYNRNGRALFPDYAFKGRISDNQFIDVDLYKDEYQSLKPGEALYVYKRIGEPDAYILKNYAQGFRPFTQIGGYWFSWHLYAGGFFFVLGLFLYVMFRFNLMEDPYSD